MDTDDLSQQTYRAIMIEAERFNHDLTLQFGLLSGDCKDEDDFILKSEEMVNEFLDYNEVEIDDLFFGNPPPKKDFHNALNRIFENIREVKKIPVKDRTYDEE